MNFTAFACAFRSRTDSTERSIETIMEIGKIMIKITRFRGKREAARESGKGESLSQWIAGVSYFISNNLLNEVFGWLAD